MRGPGGLLRSIAGRAATAALVLVAALPAFIDFHVLAPGHEVADILAEGTRAEVSRVAADCAHGAAAHVEASAIVSVPRCAACTLRSPARSVPEVALLAERLLPLGHSLAAPERLVSPLLATHRSSRGPPRA